MKKRDIILDFTSMLDVTLIIIFFFVLFSHFESQENKAATEQAVNEYNEATKEVQEKAEEYEELNELLKEALEKVKESDEREAYDLEALLRFAQSGTFKLILEIQENGWSLNVTCNNEVCEKIGAKDDISSTMRQLIVNQGYTEEHTILFDFVYDGSQPGTAKAYRTIKKELEAIKSQYKYMYISETNLSVGRE